MLIQFGVEIPTSPVNQCHSHLIRYLEECCDSLSYRRAAEKGRQAFGTRMVYRETFLQIRLHLHAPCPQELHQWNSSEEPLHSSTGQNKIKIRDASLDRQPKIQSSLVREAL